jgi:hypothetical protein
VLPLWLARLPKMARRIFIVLNEQDCPVIGFY